MEVFSSIRSPVFSELVIILVSGVEAHLPQEAMLFETLRKMYELRPFKLAFSFEGPCFVQRAGRSESVEPRWEVKKALDCGAAKGFLDCLDSPPTIRIVKGSRYYEWDLDFN